MRLAIDYTSTCRILESFEGQGKLVFSGGSNFANALITYLYENAHGQTELFVVAPSGFDGTPEPFLFRGQYIFAEAFESADYSTIDVLLLPQVNGTCLMRIPLIKRRYPQLKIAAVIHDRNHNLTRVDNYDSFYYDDGVSSALKSRISYYAKKKAFTVAYNRAISDIDLLYTVSNYSLQELLDAKPLHITPIVQECPRIRNGESQRGDYILLVGGGRPEKNLLRSLEAFCEFKKATSSSTRFVATGVSQQLKERLVASGKLDDEVMEESVVLLEYVSDVELDNLYANCKYVLFSSKAEGYGLPVREGMGYGKAVLASRLTAIPEVGGAAVEYFDPYDVKSIVRGYQRFENPDRLNSRERLSKIRSGYLDQIARLDYEMMLFDLEELGCL